MRALVIALAVALPLACTATPAAEPSPSTAPTDVATTPADTSNPTPKASRAATPGRFGSADLPRIVLGEDHLESGWTVDDVVNGREALVQPVALLEHSSFAEQPGFVDARMTRIGTSGQGSYWEEGGYVTWTAVYASDKDAEAALEVLIQEHVSETGWAMQRAGLLPHGDEGVSLEGAAYGFDDNVLYVWRDANLLLAAGAIGVTATPDDAADRLMAILDGMVERTG